MTYKLVSLLFLPKKKKKSLINIKSLKIMFFYFLWFTYIRLLIFLH